MEVSIKDGLVTIPMDEFEKIKKIVDSMPTVEIIDDSPSGFWYFGYNYGDSPPVQRYYVKNDVALAKLQKINDETINTMRQMKNVLDKNPTYQYRTGPIARVWFLLSGKLMKKG